MTFEQYYNNQVNEGLKDKLLPLGLAASLFGAAPEALAAKKTATKPAIAKVASTNDVESIRQLIINTVPRFDFSQNSDDLVKQFENSKNYPRGNYDKKLEKWFEYSDEGKPAIAYGHNITPQEKSSNVFKNGITDKEAIQLLRRDIAAKESKIKEFIPDYDTFSKELKNALILAVYRGDIKREHRTVKLINEHRFADAAIEFLNNQDFRKSGPQGGVGKRMLAIAKILYDADKKKKVNEEIDTPNNGFLSRPIGGPNLVNFSPNFKAAPGGIYLGSDQIHTPTVQLTKIKALKASRKFNKRKKR